MAKVFPTHSKSSVVCSPVVKEWHKTTPKQKNGLVKQPNRDMLLQWLVLGICTKLDKVSRKIMFKHICGAVLQPHDLVKALKR